MELLAAEALGQEQAQHVLADEGVDHPRREFAAAVHFGTMLVQQRLQGASPFRSTRCGRRLNAGIHEDVLGIVILRAILGWL